MTIDAKTLDDFIQQNLQDKTLIIASSTEPYKHFDDNGKIVCKFGGGGLVAALDPVMQACGGVWIAAGSGDADRAMVDGDDRVQVPEGDPKYTLKRVWHDKEEADKYYDGFSNQVMWPMCHDLYVKPNFDPSFWEVYKRVNQKYADLCFEEAEGKGDVIFFLQDYHISLVAKHIKERKPNAVCVIFWHIPWPRPEVIQECPWAKELLGGLLSNDIIGFHIDSYSKNFLKTVELILPDAKVDHDNWTINYNGHRTQVKSYPISVNFTRIDELARSSDVQTETDFLKKEYPYEYLGVGVERVDYSKGIPERLRALERFIEKYPEYKEKFVYVQLAAPSRIKMQEYIDLNNEIDGLIERINGKYPDWKPVRYVFEKIPFPRVIALYANADFCVVSPLRDGMNLVTKEFVASQKDENGVLVLSDSIGATQELGPNSVLINPSDTEAFADALKRAIEMPAEERRGMMHALREQVRENNIYKWVYDILSDSVEIIPALS